MVGCISVPLVPIATVETTEVSRLLLSAEALNIAGSKRGLGGHLRDWQAEVWSSGSNTLSAREEVSARESSFLARKTCSSDVCGHEDGFEPASLSGSRRCMSPKSCEGRTEWAKSDKFTHALLFGEGGALNEGGLKVFVSLFSLVTNENITSRSLWLREATTWW